MSKYVLVETISQFRQRYVIEVPDDHNDKEFPCDAETWAMDTVTCEQMKEFSQLWLGEVITDARQITKEEIIPLCDKDNTYVKSWTDEQKFDSFVTQIGYERDF